MEKKLTFATDFEEKNVVKWSFDSDSYSTQLKCIFNF